jgi:replication-associated recombination protein RarA
MGHFALRTKNGYDFFEAASALQKSIRRNDVVVAAYFGVELWASGYGN